jgi:hypothetical protein
MLMEDSGGTTVITEDRRLPALTIQELADRYRVENQNYERTLRALMELEKYKEEHGVDEHYEKEYPIALGRARMVLIDPSIQLSF